MPNRITRDSTRTKHSLMESARRGPRTEPRAIALWAAALSVLLFAAAEPAQESRAHPPELKFALIFSRHGVRSPIWTNEQLNQYSAEAWPKWDVPPGKLTPHGEKLMRLFGAYDRAYLALEGLVNATG